MSKRLVVCLDGTWNTPDKGANPTNVVKIMRSIRPTGNDGKPQITFYDTGVGTGGPVDSIFGGAFGRGLGENVKDGYRFLANNYEPGDEIYIFGFSRGAFTARCLAGFIACCGISRKTMMGELPDVWQLFADRANHTEHQRSRLGQIRALSATDVRITCLGVWDTVGSLGIPVESLQWVNRERYEFLDAKLGANVDHAFHALAIDEKRGPFGPTLWQEPDHDDNETVEQVWFVGVHSNIGGSYPDARLSDLPLRWMIDRVRATCDLAFDEGHVKDSVDGNHLGTLYESRGPLYTVSKLLPYQRLIGQNTVEGSWLRRWLPRTNRPEAGRPFVNEMIHRSAIDRFGKLAPVDGEGEVLYQPANLAAAIGKLPVVEYDGTISPAVSTPIKASSAPQSVMSAA
ncbi:MAG: DUF2235 domain-containing protein [Pseudomonadota bacterium]